MTSPRETEPTDEPGATKPRVRGTRLEAEVPSRWWRELAPFVGPAVVVAVYAVLRLVYIELSDSDGVLTATGSVDGALAALALATFLLRMLALVVVPFVVVYRLVVRVLVRRDGAR